MMASLQHLCVFLWLISLSQPQNVEDLLQENDQTAAGELNLTSEPDTENSSQSTLSTSTTTEGTDQPVTDGSTEAPTQPKIAFGLEEGGTGPKTKLLANSDGSKKTLGSKCTTDQDCVSLENTNCRDGMCLCSDGYILSKHKLDLCLKTPTGLGDACEEEAQCEAVVFDSECQNSKCVCLPNYVFNQTTSRCWEKQMLGGKCNNSGQCVDVNHAVCSQGVCTCQDPLIPSPGNKCLPPAGPEFKAACEEDIQCTHTYGDESRCSARQCVCTSNNHYNGSKCIPNKKLGDACLSDSECNISDGSFTEDSRVCLGNACVCATGFSSLRGEDMCTKSSGEELAVSLTWVLCIVLAKYYLV